MELTRYPFKPVNRSSAPRNPSPHATSYGTTNKAFCAAVDHVVTNNQLPPEFQNDCVSFLNFVMKIMSVNYLPKKCTRAFEAFASQLPKLPKNVRESMADAVTSYKPRPHVLTQCYINKLKRSLNDIFLNREETAKLEQIKQLELYTAAPRTRGDARIPAHQFADLPDLKAFLESDEVTTRLYGYRGIRDAREALDALIPRLKPLEVRFKEPEPTTKSLLPWSPKSFSYDALGKGKNAYIVIDKPCWKDRRDWTYHCENKDALQQARGELDVIRKNKRTSGF